MPHRFCAFPAAVPPHAARSGHRGPTFDGIVDAETDRAAASAESHLSHPDTAGTPGRSTATFRWTRPAIFPAPPPSASGSWNLSFRGRRRAVLARSAIQGADRGIYPRHVRGMSPRHLIRGPEVHAPLRPHRSLMLAPPPKLLGEVWPDSEAGALRLVPRASGSVPLPRPGPRGGAGWIPRPCVVGGACENGEAGPRNDIPIPLEAR
jgi:hypothetical protein